MAKRGEKFPHLVRFEWSNGNKGSKSCRNEAEVESFKAQLHTTAEQRDLQVTIEHIDRTGS